MPVVPPPGGTRDHEEPGCGNSTSPVPPAKPPRNRTPFMALWVVPARQLGVGWEMARLTDNRPSCAAPTPALTPPRTGWLDSGSLPPPQFRRPAHPEPWSNQCLVKPLGQEAGRGREGQIGSASGQMFWGGSSSSRVPPCTRSCSGTEEALAHSSSCPADGEVGESSGQLGGPA